MKKYGVKKLAQKKLIIYSSIQLIITAVSLYFLRDVFNIAFSLFFIGLRKWFKTSHFSAKVQFGTFDKKQRCQKCVEDHIQ